MTDEYSFKQPPGYELIQSRSVYLSPESLFSSYSQMPSVRASRSYYPAGSDDHRTQRF